MSNREAGADGSHPAYRNPHNPKHMKELCELWNLDFDSFHPEVPKDILTMLEVAERGEIGFLWVIGTNPLVSMPDQNRTRKILEKLFVVVQDPFTDTETVATADIYFPAAMWGEKTGCVTNAERNVNLLLKAVDPPGQARSDLDIFLEVANRLGFKDRAGQPLIQFADSRQAFDEWRRVSKGRPCDYSGMTYELILEHGAIRWPCNELHPTGTERLYEDLKFWTGIDECETYGADFLTGNKLTRSDYERIDPHGKAFLRPARWRLQPNPPSEDYPFVLSTGRVVYHFHTRTKTGRSAALNDRAPHAYVEIHPADAEQLEIRTGDLAEVTSPHGRWEGPAVVVDTVRPGELFIPFHYGGGRSLPTSTPGTPAIPSASSRNSSQRPWLSGGSASAPPSRGCSSAAQSLRERRSSPTRRGALAGPRWRSPFRECRRLAWCQLRGYANPRLRLQRVGLPTHPRTEELP
jgi:ferredoxin-nitrate reductase